MEAFTGAYRPHRPTTLQEEYQTMKTCNLILIFQGPISGMLLGQVADKVVYEGVIDWLGLCLGLFILLMFSLEILCPRRP